MLSAIIRKEFLGHILTLRFIAGTIFCLALFLASAFVLTANYHERVDAYQAATARHRDALTTPWTFSLLKVGVDRPPTPLSLFCRGVDSSLPTSSQFELIRAPQAAIVESDSNPLLVVFPSFDLAMVVQVIMSLLALLFGYDAISGERQRGTLALMLANQLPRSTVLIGKYLGSMAVLIPLLLLGTAQSLIVMLASPYVQFSGQDWLALLLLLLVSCGYLSLVWLVCMAISAITRRARTSLVICLFIWVVAVLIAPQMASAAASALRPLPSQYEQVAAENQVLIQADQEIYGYARNHPMPLCCREDRFNVKRESMYSGGIPLLSEIYAGPREYIDWVLGGTRHALPLLVDAENQIQELRLQAALERAKQAGLARWLRRLTPAAAYYDSVAAISGTDHTSYLGFWQAVGQYRMQVVEYARARDGLDFRFFTDEKAITMPSQAELIAMEERGESERLQQLLGDESDQKEPLDLSDMPRISLTSLSFSDRLAGAGLDLALLIVLNMLMLLLAAILFANADVRSG